MKKKTKILACVLAGLVLLAVAVCVLCLSRTAGFYSEKQHLSRVQKRAEKRFLGEGSEYTGLEVYPIYNEDDKLEYVLIELAPQGFMYVKINDSDFFEWLGGVSMYTMANEEEPYNWMPYRVKAGMVEEITDLNGNIRSFSNIEFFRDENGEVIRYFESHFKVAGIENERRYLLRTPISEGGSSNALIPAVKRGEQYLDLVDGELINYEQGVYSATYATGYIHFIPKLGFDL